MATMSTETLDNIWRPSSAHQTDSSAEQRARLIREMAGSKRSRSSLDSGSVRDDDGLPRGDGWGRFHKPLVASPVTTSTMKAFVPIMICVCLCRLFR